MLDLTACQREQDGSFVSVKEAPWFQVRATLMVADGIRHANLASSWHAHSLFLWSWGWFSCWRTSSRWRCRRDGIIVGTIVVAAQLLPTLTIIMKLHTTTSIRHDYCATFECPTKLFCELSP